MVVDSEEHDDLGLPLVRGPFDTLEDARAAIEVARSGPAPVSDLPTRARRVSEDGASKGKRPKRTREAPAAPPPVEVRGFRIGDGPKLRELWDTCDMRSIGDDDESLATMHRRNPGTVLVAVQSGEVVGSVLGGWDGRRGWIYHLAVAEQHRRTGLGRRLVAEVESKLRGLGGHKANAMVQDGNDGATAFWNAMGYTAHDARQFGKELDEPASGDESS